MTSQAVVLRVWQQDHKHSYAHSWGVFHIHLSVFTLGFAHEKCR